MCDAQGIKCEEGTDSEPALVIDDSEWSAVGHQSGYLSDHSNDASLSPPDLAQHDYDTTPSQAHSVRYWQASH